MDDVSNYVASEWKRDLTHIISCYWKAQVSPLTSSEWTVAIDRFIRAMRVWKESKWVDIKELNPLGYMPYIVRQFQKVTGVSLSGLDDFTGWVVIGGYYHWRLSELGQLHACPRLPGQPMPDGPIGRPSGWPLPMPAVIKTPMSGASQQGGNQPSNGGGKMATSTRGGKQSTSTRGGKSASTARGGNQTASGGPIDLPSERAGAGDGQSWFDQSIQEAAWEEGGS